MLVFLTLLAGCNDPGFALVSISPIYGWTDGCNAVTLSGHGFGKDATAKIGGAAVTGVTFPEPPKNPLTPSNVGYIAYGVAPAGSHGYAEVSLTSSGQTSTITGTGGYYYVSCPAPGSVDAVTPAEAIAGGALIALDGCSLDAATMTVRLVDATDATVADGLALTSLCGKGSVTFEAPVLADGTYFIELVDTGTGAVLSGAPCPPADSADTASSCSDHAIVYGVAQ